MRALRRETAMLAGRQIPVTASVGVALFGALTDIEILAAADSAMYKAKEAGRDQSLSGPVRRHLESRPGWQRPSAFEPLPHTISLILSCQPSSTTRNNR